MITRRRFSASVLGAATSWLLGQARSSAFTATLAPPPRAAQAGFSHLIFDEEFDSAPDIGFGTPGHKWNAGLWWEPLPSPNAFSVTDSVLTITATPHSAVNLA